MSPFEVEFIRHYPARGRNLAMWRMHLKTLLGKHPYHTGSMRIVQNELTVTKINGHFRGNFIACYVVQIAGRSVRGIESYIHERQRIERGSVFGMIRIGSQVDLLAPWRKGMQLRVQPGDKVRAGETILIQ